MITLWYDSDFTKTSEYSKTSYGSDGSDNILIIFGFLKLSEEFLLLILKRTINIYNKVNEHLQSSLRKVLRYSYPTKARIGGEMKLLCRLGIHWPLELIEPYFVDRASNKMIYQAKCACGRNYTTEGKYSPFRVRQDKLNPNPILDEHLKFKSRREEK